MDVKRFMNLFKGFESAHGQYRVNKKEADGKMSGRAVTVSDPATEINFKEHLDGGEYILGVIPLLNNNSCHFGVIDIDIRGEVKLNESLESLEKKIRDTPWYYVVLSLAVLICIFSVSLPFLLLIWLQN